MVPKVVIPEHYTTMEIGVLLQNLFKVNYVLGSVLLYNCKASLTFGGVILPSFACLVIIQFYATTLAELEISL